MLNREEMESLVARGESVMHDGKIITTVAGLPSAASLAHGDAEATKKAAHELRVKIARDQAELDLLSPPKRGPGRPSKAELEADEAAKAELDHASQSKAESKS